MLISIDPGLSTGMAFRFDNGQWGTLTIPHVPDAQERLSLVLNTVLERLGPDHTCEGIVIEAFVTMGYLSRFGIETIELVGALKAVSLLYQVPLTKQVAVERMGMERTAYSMLKERKVPYTDHEVSALAHLLAYEHKKARAAGGDSKIVGPPLPTTMGQPKVTVKPAK